MKEKATIYDLWRMCAMFPKCERCPLDGMCDIDATLALEYLDRINEIILNWCKEHPVKTRQDKFLEIFPNTQTDNGAIDICPKKVGNYGLCESDKICSDCRKSYWLAEVEEW